MVAGEKKLKTGEKMVPSSVVRGGLLAASTGASNLPFGFMGLLLQVMASKQKTTLNNNSVNNICFLIITVASNRNLVCSTFILTSAANSGDWFVGKASSLWC